MKSKKRETVLTYDLRENLKKAMQKEIENLPALLEGLEPKERINIVCRLMPFVFPRVEAIHPQSGEPLQTDW